jgi:hypothetical protein
VLESRDAWALVEAPAGEAVPDAAVTVPAASA